MVERKYWDPEIETAPPEINRRRQTEKLKALVKRVYDNTVFYRRRFDEAGIKPEDIQTLEDLQRIPPTRYLEDFVATPVEDKLAVPIDKVVLIESTSGTISGSPQLVMSSVSDLDAGMHVFTRGLVMCGIGKGDVYQPLIPLSGLELAAREAGFTVLPFSHAAFSMDNLLRLMVNAKTTAIFTFPSQFLGLVRRASELGIDIKKIGLRTAFFAGESWSGAYRQKMESDWGISFYDYYGTTEVGEVSVECPEKTGMHCWPDTAIVEIIDPETGEVLGPGQPGEIVATTLWREAMPLLRFRTGDVAEWLEYEPCGCGRTLAKISRIKGRTEHMIKVGKARVFPSDVEEAVHATPGLTGEYQILVKRPGVQEALEVKVEYGPESTDLSILTTSLERTIEHSTGARVKVNLVPPGTIPAGIQWKAQRIAKAYEETSG